VSVLAPRRLRVVNISNPAAPFEVGSSGALGSAIGVAVAGAYAYGAAWDAGLEILLSCEGLIFQDDVESGDTSLWSATAP
jgi:hypothetical protein